MDIKLDEEFLVRVIKFYQLLSDYYNKRKTNGAGAEQAEERYVF